MVRITYSQLGAPPSLTGSEAEAVKAPTSGAAAAPTVGIPKPVEDSKAGDESDAATQSQLASASAGASTSSEAGASTVVDEAIPDKNVYVNVDKSPVLVHQVETVYPEIAKKAGIEGKVFVQMLIDVDGLVMRAEVVKSSGNTSLDEAAVDAAKQWLFTPAVAPGGKTTRVWIMQPFTFKLH